MIMLTCLRSRYTVDHGLYVRAGGSLRHACAWRDEVAPRPLFLLLFLILRSGADVAAPRLTTAQHGRQRASGIAARAGRFSASPRIFPGRHARDTTHVPSSRGILDRKHLLFAARAVILTLAFAALGDNVSPRLDVLVRYCTTCAAERGAITRSGSSYSRWMFGRAACRLVVADRLCGLRAHARSLVSTLTRLAAHRVNAQAEASVVPFPLWMC